MGQWLVLILPAEYSIGLVLLTLAIRGVPEFGAPRCRKCSYDLRMLRFDTEAKACPECGADLKAPKAVRFGTHTRRVWKIVLGIVVLLSPIPTFMGIRYVSERYLLNGSIPSANTATPIIMARLSAHADEPWYWGELERRVGAGTLSAQDTDAAMATLIAHVAKRGGGTKMGPLSWQQGFVKAVMAKNAAAPERFKELCLAYYGQAPDIQILVSSQRGLRNDFNIQYGMAWNLPGVVPVWFIREQKVDGKAADMVTNLTRNNNAALKGDDLSGTRNDWPNWQINLPPDLPAGTHEVEILMDIGIIPENAKLTGAHGRPGTPDKWPSPLCTWQADIKKKVTVTAPAGP